MAIIFRGIPLLNRLSLRANIAGSVLAMGILAVVLALTVAETYRQYAIDSQRTAFEQIIGLRVETLLQELTRVSHDLGQALQSEKGFRQLFRERDTAVLEQELDSQFHQYFVTAGIIKLESLAIYDDKFTPIARVFSDNSSTDAGCSGLHARAASRKGPQRLKTVTELCLVAGKPYFSLLLPVGGLRLKGYLEVVTDPMYSLRVIEQNLGMPLRMRYADGSISYQSEDWPSSKAERQGVIATFQPKTEEGKPAFSLAVARDVSVFAEQLAAARNKYLAVVGGMSLLLALIMIYLLNKTALQPLHRLGEQLRNIRRDKKQLGKPVAVSGNAEIRELASGFNEMTNELKELYDTLLNRNEELSQEIEVREYAERELKKHRHHLEELVEQRTQDLATARDAALEASRSKSLFLANMSHELRTPLNAIIGYSEILMEDAIASDGGRSVPDLKKVHAAGKHLLSLINDILDLTKIEAGKMDLYEEWFDVGHLLKNIAETIQPLVLQNQNRLTIDCPTDVGNMYADSTKIRQTLVNLLNNACKFTQRGDVHVKVWREAKDENEQIFFSVQDSGIGMSREQQDKLFEAFSQADASATRKFGGTGLGLVISQHYCNMMGGHIHVASELGQGATFTVSLPLKKGPSQENVQTIPDELAASWQAEAVASEVRYSPMPQSDNVERREHLSTVLVIDDDPSVHDIMTHYLTQKGFNVHTASSGAEGLEQAADIKPDVITLDVMMPGMDGWAVLKALKQDPELCDIPVIMVSMVENRNMGFSLGAIDYLSKPIEKERLCDVVNRCVRSSREGTVLVVEDNDALRTSIKDILALDGWTVKAVQSAESAFSTMGENPPVLIMLDLMMPEMDGFEFLNQLQHNPRWSDIPVVVISGKQLSVEEHRQLQGRVAKVVNKAAYHHDELLDKVYHIVNKSLGSGKKVMSEFDETVFLD